MSLLTNSVGAGAKNRPDDVAIMQFVLANVKSKTTRKPYLPKVWIDGRMSRDLQDAIAFAIADHGSNMEI